MAEVIDPHPSHRAPPIFDQGIPFVGIGDVSEDGQIDVSSARSVSPLIAAEHKLRYTVAVGDIGFGRVATVGKVIRFGTYAFDFTLSPTLALIKPHGIDRTFLIQYLQSQAFDEAASRLLTGTTRSSLGIQLLRRLEVTAPACLKEQAAIGTVLDTLDTTIRQTEAIIAKLKQVKHGLLHDLLTRGIGANGELRPPQSQAPHLYKKSPLGWIPKDWIVQRLADFMSDDITYGIVQAGPHIDGGIPYIRTGDMSGTRLTKSSLLCTSRRIANSYRRSEVRAGDIVMAIRATVGKVLPVPQELDGANLTQGTARLAPNGRTDGRFLLWAIRHQRAQDSILAEIKGTTFAEITLAALREVPLAAPAATSEQGLIGERIDACEERILMEDLQRQKLQALKSGLMDDLLTGRVRVTPLLA